MTGTLLILVSTFAYNGSAVLLAMAARQYSGRQTLLVGVVRHVRGLLAISLSLLGWILEVAALTLISLTLARILNVAGLGILLWLTRWVLKEPLGRREILGVSLIALGVAATSITPPRLASAPPSPAEWGLLLALLGPGVLLPYILRILRRQVGFTLEATAAGLAYALSGVLNKGIADEGVADTLHSGRILPLVLLIAGIAVIGLLGFDTELRALREGYASIVVPIVLALHTIVPIVCAPFLFGEAWPVGLLSRALLGSGILLTLLGILLLASTSSHVLTKR